MTSINQREKALSEESADQEYMQWLDGDVPIDEPNDKRLLEDSDVEKQPLSRSDADKS